MRAAPAVQARLDADVAWITFVRALTALALAGLGAWTAGWLLLPDWGGVAPAALAVVAGLAGWTWGPKLAAAPAGTLRWDGAAWSWQPERSDVALGCSLAVMVDLGPWLLLRLRPQEGAAVWLPVAQRRCGTAWPALRAALHARGALK